MSELTNIHARAVKDLTTPTELPADPDALDQVKLAAGNFPAEYAGNEALTVKQIKDIATVDIESKVEVELSNLSTTANKFYPTLSEANSHLATMSVNDVVTIGEEANKGLWYKATAGATTLTKSLYDPLTQANNYTNNKASTAKTEAVAIANNYTDSVFDAVPSVIAPYVAQAEAAATVATIGAGVFETPEAGVDPTTGVEDGEYFNVRSPSSDSYIDEYQNIDGVATPSGKTYPSGAYVQNIVKYTARPFVEGKTYSLNERVQLTNGNIVKSTIVGNVNDPNVNMTGWVNFNSASQIVDASGKTQQEVNTAVLYTVSSAAELRLTAPIKKGQKVYLESHILDNGLGCGEFIATQKNGLADNNGTIFASPNPLIFWVRVDQRYPCPEWWGATGKDNGVDATVAVRAAVDYGRINKKVVTCDNHYILSDEIYAGTFEGITSTNRGTFHINADVTPFRFAGIAGNKWFERVSFRYKVAATNTKPTILFDFQFLVLGMKLRDLEFWGDTGKTWVGVGIKGKNNYGFSGGFEFSNIRSHTMHADLHFIGGATFWANAGRISNNMCYYNNYGILIDEGCNVNNLLIQNYQGQENVQYTICANGRLGKSIIDLSYNWDTNRPAIFLSEFCGGVTIRGTYMHDIVDLGYKTLIDVKNIDVLTDTAIASTLITMEGEYTEASLNNVLKITKTGNVQVSEGTHSEFTTGNNRTGYTVYTTPATAEPVTQAGQLKMFNPATQITGLATRLAGYSQWTAVRFQANFEILTTTLDEDAFIFGVGNSASNDIPSTLWVGITVRSGRLKVISKTGASTETVIADLGAVTKRRIDFQMIIKARDGLNKQPIHVNGKLVGYYEVNPAFNKSPFVSIKSVSNPTGIHVISLGLRNQVAAGHTAVVVS